MPPVASQEVKVSFGPVQITTHLRLPILPRFFADLPREARAQYFMQPEPECARRFEPRALGLPS